LISAFHLDTKWKKDGIIIARSQLNFPHSIFVDDNQTIYIPDWGNHCIVEWKYNTINGEIVPCQNGTENQIYQLHYPIDVIIDQTKHSLIISDLKNRRVIQYSQQISTKNQHIIIENIDCWGLAMDKTGHLYASNCMKNEVRRFKIGEPNGELVAGGKEQGDGLHQLDYPTYIFVDENNSLYVSDSANHRVMKWLKNAKEGIIVAGGNGRGNKLTQLSFPRGIFVDQLSQVYVVDKDNNRMVRWSEGAKEGTNVIGGDKNEENTNQLHSPSGLSFDQEENLYIVDRFNNRIQKFELD
jgi:hypothetical protein